MKDYSGNFLKYVTSSYRMELLTFGFPSGPGTRFWIGEGAEPNIPRHRKHLLAAAH